jgi:hypothetical protein
VAALALCDRRARVAANSTIGDIVSQSVLGVGVRPAGAGITMPARSAIAAGRTLWMRTRG